MLEDLTPEQERRELLNSFCDKLNITGHIFIIHSICVWILAIYGVLPLSAVGLICGFGCLFSLVSHKFKHMKWDPGWITFAVVNFISFAILLTHETGVFG